VTASSANAPAAAGKLDQGIVRRKHRVTMTQREGYAARSRGFRAARARRTRLLGWCHSADSSINARWSVRRKPATAGSTTADPPQTDAYGMGGAACIGFDVIFNRAVLEIVSQY
jgi:hypothetical protein